jgi:hypothetical protein
MSDPHFQELKCPVKESIEVPGWIACPVWKREEDKTP